MITGLLVVPGPPVFGSIPEPGNVPGPAGPSGFVPGPPGGEVPPPPPIGPPGFGVPGFGMPVLPPGVEPSGYAGSITISGPVPAKTSVGITGGTSPIIIGE